MTSRWQGFIASGAAVLVLGALLTATIYWTLFDPKWIAFLGGVIFAATLAGASRMSTLQWRLARRNLQVERLRLKLSQEAGRAHAATDAIAAGEERMQLLCDALSTPVLFIDRD